MILPTERDSQTLMDVVRRVLGLKGGPGIRVQNGPGGITISLSPTKDYTPWQNAGLGNGTVGFHITGNATGQCIYTAKTYTDPTTDIDGSSDLSASNFGTAASSNDALVLNMPELGFSVTGHDVTNANNTFSLYGQGRICHTNADGTKVIEANMFYSTCKASS